MKIAPSTPVAIGVCRVDDAQKVRLRKPACRKRPHGRAFDSCSRVFNEPAVLNAECKESRQTGELAVRRQTVVAPSCAEIHQLWGRDIAQPNQTAVLCPGKQLLLE